MAHHVHDGTLKPGNYTNPWDVTQTDSISPTQRHTRAVHFGHALPWDVDVAGRRRRRVNGWVRAGVTTTGRWSRSTSTAFFG